MVLNFIKNILCKRLGWFCPPPEEKALKLLEKTAYDLENKYKDHALTKRYEYLKSIKADTELIEESINDGVKRLEVYEKWNFYENLIKHSYVKPETESDLKNIIYDAKQRRIVFEIYHDKCEKGIIKDEKKEELEEYIRKQSLENRKLIKDELRHYHIYSSLQEMWNRLLNTELDKLNKFTSEYNSLEECKEELINQNNRLNSLKYCANNYITEAKLSDEYKKVNRFLPYDLSETKLYAGVSDILKPMFEEIKGKIDDDVASLLNEEIIKIFCERLNKERLMR